MAVGRIGRLTSASMISLMYEGMGEGVRRGSVSANGRTRSHISKCVVTSDDGWPKRASSKLRRRHICSSEDEGQVDKVVE